MMTIQKRGDLRGTARLHASEKGLGGTFASPAPVSEDHRTENQSAP